MTLNLSSITDEQFVKVRCSLDGRTHYFSAIGSMYAQPLDDSESKHLFNFIGVDVSRCIQDQSTSQWALLSRKITLYLEPKTGEVLNKWQNPWTGETLNVIHRSYDYQEFLIPQHVKAYIGEEISFISLDQNSKSPNPLAKDPKFTDYSPEEYLRSSGAYKFIFPTKILTENPINLSSDRSVTLSYHRTGPWEPWMKMKGKPGFIVLNYTGTKTDAFADLHPAIQAQIENRLPLYREAPISRLKRSIGTSWSRFPEEFEAYLRGDEFPLPAPIKDETTLELSSK